MPVHAATTSAMSSAPTSSLHHRRRLGGLGQRHARASSSFSSSRDAAVEDLGGRGQVARRAAARSASPRSSSSCSLSSPTRFEARTSPAPSGPSARAAAPAVGEVGAQLRRAAPEAASVSLARAPISSIFSRSTARRSSSISTGEESISIRSRRGGLVDQVDRLVGQLAAGDVAVGQRGRGDQRGVGDPTPWCAS